MDIRMKNLIDKDHRNISIKLFHHLFLFVFISFLIVDEKNIANFGFYIYIYIEDRICVFWHENFCFEV
jgi:hypothetical protein